MSLPFASGVQGWTRSILRGRTARLGLVLALVILLLVTAGTAFVRARTDGPDATIPVATRLPGLSGSVTVTYDDAGIPHITAATLPDAMAGLCYAEAHDRLFQMVFDRLAAQGRLASVFGAGPDDVLLAEDLLDRSIDYQSIAVRQWPRLSANTRGQMTGCAAGVNAYLSRAVVQHMLPPEFAMVGYTPEPWKATDSLVLTDWIFASLDTDTFLTKLTRGAALAIGGSDLAAALIPDANGPALFDAQGHLAPVSAFLQPPTPFGGNAAAAPASSTLPTGAASALAGVARLLAAANLSGFNAGDRASNNWGVDGHLTASGKPLLANDPHVQLTTPSQAYLAAYTVGHTTFEGITLPGAPFWISGHSSAGIAFTATLTLQDDADLYQERLRTASTAASNAPAAQQVMFNGTWVAAPTRLETIVIAPSTPGGHPTTQQLPVTTTPHGPIIDAALGLDPAAVGALSLKLAVADPRYSVDGLFALPQATDWASFRAAATGKLAAGLNLVFGDDRGPYGHVGYQMSAFVPVRSADNAEAPVPGWDGAHEWTGVLPGGQLPSVYDPPSHVLVTANNPIVAADWTGGYVSNVWDVPWRAEQISRDLVARANTHKLTPADFTAIQDDTHDVAAPPIAAALSAAATRTGVASAASRRAAATASAWDGDTSAGSAGAAIYETWLALYVRDLAQSALGADAYQGYAYGVFYSTQVLAAWQQLVRPSPAAFGVSTDAAARAKSDTTAAQALDKTVALLSAQLGPDQGQWAWGKIHILTYNHPLAAIDDRFNLGTFPTGGDVGSPNTGGWFTGIGALAQGQPNLQAAFAVDALAIARVIWNLGDADGSYGIVSTGESGDPSSPHFGDMAALWRAGQTPRLAFTQAAIGQHAAAAFRLLPA